MRFTKQDYVRPKTKVSRKLLRELWDRTNGKCGYCGNPMVWPKKGITHSEGYKKNLMASTDHIIPLNKGGEHVVSNILCCCSGCNSSKANRSLEEFRGYLFHRVMKVPLFSREQIDWLENSGFVFPDKHISFFFEQSGFEFSLDVGLREQK